METRVGDGNQAGAYQSRSRRPIANIFRHSARPAVEWCLRFGIHPDIISYGSMIAAAAAGICFWRAGRWPWLLLIAPGFCYLRLWCNMLDGMVALAAGKASRRGEILNDLPDRVSDIIIFAGVACGGLCHPSSAYWSIIFAVMTAYVGTLGQAVAGRREFGGWMSKPWRMVALHVGAWATLALIIAHRPIHFFHLAVLDWTNLIVILGCAETIIVRLAATLRLLR